MQIEQEIVNIKSCLIFFESTIQASKDLRILGPKGTSLIKWDPHSTFVIYHILRREFKSLMDTMLLLLLTQERYYI